MVDHTRFPELDILEAMQGPAQKDASEALSFLDRLLSWSETASDDGAHEGEDNASAQNGSGDAISERLRKIAPLGVYEGEFNAEDQ